MRVPHSHDCLALGQWPQIPVGSGSWGVDRCWRVPMGGGFWCACRVHFKDPKSKSRCCTHPLLVSPPGEQQWGDLLQ